MILSILMIISMFEVVSNLAMPQKAFAANESLSSVTQTHMYFNCNEGSTAFKTYTIEHGLCPNTSNSAITPLDTVPGDCGDTFINVSVSVGGEGIAYATFGADSSIGPIEGGSALVSGVGGSYAYPVEGNNGAYSWLDDDSYILSAGNYTAELSGGANVLIADLFPTTCYFEGATAPFKI